MTAQQKWANLRITMRDLTTLMDQLKGKDDNHFSAWANGRRSMIIFQKLGCSWQLLNNWNIITVGNHKHILIMLDTYFLIHLMQAKTGSFYWNIYIYSPIISDHIVIPSSYTSDQIGFKWFRDSKDFIISYNINDTLVCT